MPQLDRYPVRVAKVERLADAVDDPDRRVSHALSI